jgi:chromosome segregation ATPase
VHQLGEEIRQLHSEKNELILQITHKDISLADAKSKFSIKSEEMQALQSKMKEEIQALQSRAEELEQDLSLAQEKLSEMESLQSRAENLERDVFLAREELSEMESFRRKWELRNAELFTKNIDLDLEKRDLEDTLIKKKDELAQMIDNLATAQKAIIEKDTLLQEVVLNNTRLAKQIPKTSSKSEVIGGISELEKDNGITSPETTPKLPNSNFFQHAIIFVIVILIIYILWYVFSCLYSSYNEEKNILNYKILLNRNQSYDFLIRYEEEPKDRTASYKTLFFGYR